MSFAICLLLSLPVLGALGLALLYIYESANSPEARLPAPRPVVMAFVLTFCGALASVLLCALLRPLNRLCRVPEDLESPESPERSESPGGPESPEGKNGALAGKLPVVFIHGLYDKPSAWLYLARKCAAQGRQVRCFAYDSRGATPQGVTRAFDDYLRGLEVDFKGRRPVLAGHSLGGLIIRNWLREPANRGRIAGVITLGTPHGGSRCAHLAPGMLAAAITPDSAFIRDLAAFEAGGEATSGSGAAFGPDGAFGGGSASAAFNMPARISLASPTDGAVLPAAALLPPPGWAFRSTPVCGHYTMLFSPSVWRMFCEELEKMDRDSGKISSRS